MPLLKKKKQQQQPKYNAVAVSVTDRPDRLYISAVYTQCKELRVVHQSILTMLSSVQKYVYMQC